jgi:hypothetical protein
MRALFTIFFVMVVAAQADTVLTVTFTPDTVAGDPGSAVLIFGTLTNNTTDTVFINSDSFTFAIPGALDDSPFLANAPASLDPSQTSSSFEFFEVDIPNDQPLGAYTGVFTVLGGADGNAMDNLGSSPFEVDAVPEPAPFFLIGTVLAGLLLRANGFPSRRAR